MTVPRLLLLSNSRMVGQPYLAHAAVILKAFLTGVRTVLFVPYAAVRVSYDAFSELVRSRFAELGFGIHPIHRERNPRAAVAAAEAIAVGGGNTFHLLRQLHQLGLVEAIAERVRGGAPYVGWSAGANVACPTMKTTNDMPIVEPPSLRAMGLVPFQINPHYLDAHPQGHGGETREERLLEFVELHPGLHVVGLREGSILRLEGERLSLLGPRSARIFLKGREPWEVEPKGSLAFLLGRSATRRPAPTTGRADR